MDDPPRQDDGSPGFSRELLQRAIDNKTKPVGSLGRIESLALQIGLLQQSLTPTMESCQLTLFAGDHGLAAAGISAYPQEVTRQMVLNFLAGGAAANVFARAHGVALRVVDAGVAGEPIEHPDLIGRRIGAGTRNSSVEPAMTAVELEQALQHGSDLVADSDFDALCFGEMGIGNTSAATLVFHKLLGLPLGDLVGRGTGLDDDGVERKGERLAEAAARTATELGPEQALAEYGGFEMAMMAGAVQQAAAQRKLVLVDGFIATAAAAVVLRLEPSAREAMVFAHRSDERGHAAVLDALDAEPLLDLRLRLGEGTGALLAWPLVRSACAMLNEMASFDDAGVSGPEP